MSLREPSAARGEEIIAPIRLRPSPPAGSRTAAGRRNRRWKIAAALLLAGLAAGGLWWSGHLSRHPLPAPLAADPAEAEPRPAAASPGAPAATQPLQPSAPPLPTEAVSSPPPAPQAAAAADAASPSPAAARSDHPEALRSPPPSQPAREGLPRANPRPADEEFRRRMAEGFAALNAGDPATAQAHFLKARSLRPEAPDTAEALAQTRNRLDAARIEAARQRALAAEQREDWAGALAAYEECLGVDPALQFARQGRERTAALVNLEQRVAFFVNQPGLLESDAQLAKAERLLQEVQAAAPVGARIGHAADKLGDLVRIAKTPVPVVISSDALTEVSVYRVGRLGRFSARELSLRPGTYTVVASRDGYRDERLELVVAPGPEPIRVTVVCKEKV